MRMRVHVRRRAELEDHGGAQEAQEADPGNIFPLKPLAGEPSDNL